LDSNLTAAVAVAGSITGALGGITGGALTEAEGEYLSKPGLLLMGKAK